MSAINSNLYNNFLQVKNNLSKSAEKSEEKQNKMQEAKPIAAVALEDGEKKSSGALTKVVAVGAIAAAAVGVVIARGGSSKFFKNINQYRQLLNDTIMEYTAKGKNLTNFERLELEINKKVQKVLDVVNIGNNITALKDAGFNHLCEKLHLKKVCDWITFQFKKITVYSSRKSYQKAQNVLDVNIPRLRRMKQYITDPKLAERFEELLVAMEKEISGISKGQARMERLEQIERATQNVGKKVKLDLSRLFKSIFGHDKTKSTELAKFRIYRTEVHSAAGREQLSSTLQATERRFTFNIADKTNIMLSAKDDIANVIKPDDVESRKLLRYLQEQIQQYKKCVGPNSAAERQNVVNNLNAAVNDFKAAISGGKYSEESQVLLNTKFSEIESVLKGTETSGYVEELLEILGKSLGKEQSGIASRATSLVNEMRNVVKKATADELKLYDKFAEYSVGSAPTDVLGMLLPLGVAAYSISKGEDKDEKISATLNAGIPIVGGVATTIIAAAKMMTNVQGLILGALTGFVLNAIGSKADQGYKEWNENKEYIAKAVEAYRLANKV